jgi:positive regulator of sigma E activity
MLALSLLGTKEIIVYVVVIVLIVAGWFVLRGRSRR